MPVQRAAVIGAGAMGSGIAQVLSQAGIDVLLKDVEQSFVDRGLANIKRMYDSRVKKEVMTGADADKHFARIEGTTSYSGFGDVDLVIEAALEQIETKIEVFKQLDSNCPSRAILATNTSALSISEIGSATKRPEKVVGMHFFNPAQFMKLVEVIPGVRTSEETVQTAMALCKATGKIAVKVQECPGFLVNRLLFPYLNEALYALQEGANPEEVDRAVVAFGLPMGPFTLLDMTGIDVCAHVNEFLYGEYGPRFKTAEILQKLMKAGHLGQKSGSGVFVHPKGQVPKKDDPKIINPELAGILQSIKKGGSEEKAKQGSFDAHRVILPMFNEAIYAIQEKVVDHSDVDVAMEYGTGLKRGLLTLAKERGLDWCLKQLDEYHGQFGERFRPAWMLRKLVRAQVHDFSNLGAAPVAVH
jgi:3-hydroxyacyl-CoA dehydrogenase / enoyl-CoA hydratase / 3-hydroxybutyryl-CoA epimerase